MERIPITKEGLAALRTELERIKKIDRPENIKAIEEARAHGDLSENAEFEAAKDRQRFLEARMNELEYKISNADVIDPNKLPKDKALFGSRVRLENVDTGEDVEYQLVGPEESNIEEGRISVSSPLGKALLGKKPDDEITVQAPAGRRIYELIEIC